MSGAYFYSCSHRYFVLLLANVLTCEFTAQLSEILCFPTPCFLREKLEGPQCPSPVSTSLPPPGLCVRWALAPRPVPAAAPAACSPNKRPASECYTITCFWNTRLWPEPGLTHSLPDGHTAALFNTQRAQLALTCSEKQSSL